MDLPGTKPHPLLGRFDLDPGRWRPLYYGVEISVGTALGGSGSGSVTINNQPYIMTRVTSKIVGETGDPSTSGLYQDGQYDLAMRDENSNYQNGEIPADLMYGSVESGYIMELPYPIPYSGNKTLTFDITNRVARTLVPESTTFSVFVAVHGVADWGELQRPRR